MLSNNRILAYILIVLGLFILIGKWLSFGTFVALVLIVVGMRKVQSMETKIGYVLLGVGGAILLLEHLPLFIGIVLISLGLFYVRSRKVQPNEQVIKRQNLSTSLKWDREPYHLYSQSLWHLVGESDIDLSLAILEEPETTLLFQGVIGDIDIIIPDHIGVEIEATVLFGQIDVGHDRDTGFFNKWTWRSPNYEKMDQRVKLYLSYIVGDIDIKLH
ncbi:cell wall-active antibiotics response protein LiaF [Paenibacillus sp. ACRRX]|uniref:cell wall-active antibiotics response protein LiaF n=1 Tax=unclassified Paenibacillus TaxID=185978 RepID=UPI001EF415C2|nr:MULTISPECIES: cell wall-active antibiotics response protein LiaF [unclassified Paenibacillus]MCG7410392.1 cell wall-active antibiotics response protein LiaF [Paenibacillus sp. ACRRX]MDK8183814.1 cell wall-active antibiotics response protein LiaF [Paenibacillus sp. UMB4589-SE434]